MKSKYAAYRHLLLLGLLAPGLSHAAALAKVELSAARQAPVVEELNLTGSLTAPHSSRLALAVAGRVERTEVQAGARVTSGDVLIVLDDELARFELAQARAAEREAEVQLADAGRRVNEAQSLASNQGLAKTELLARKAEVTRMQAVLARLRAVSAYDLALVERHTLRAPFDGVVSSRDADLGEWVTPDDPVVTLVEVDRLQLDLQVPQGYFGRVAQGTRLRVGFDARPGAAFDATIAEIVPVSDPAARTFLARALVDNSDGRVTPGMSVRAKLLIGTGQQGILIPRDALVRYPDGRTVVWVTSGDGERRRVEERRVRVGLSTASDVQIRSGLEAGVDVVVRGNESLRDGQEVNVSNSR